MVDAGHLHHNTLVVDSHNDSTVGHIRRGNTGLAGEQFGERSRRSGAIRHLREQIDPAASPLQLDIPRMRQGGIDAAYFAVDVTTAWDNHLLYALDGLAWLKREIAAHSDDIGLALCAGDIARARERGRLSAILAVENSDALHRSAQIIDSLYDVGVRTMTLTHSTRSHAGDGCEVVGGGGLTGFGREVVAGMNQRGMLIDVSHLNDAGFRDVLEISSDPVIASHSCCRRLCGHPRNLTDDQLRELGETGGVVGLTFVPGFLAEENPSLSHLLDHIEHAVSVAGPGAVGLGSDFDGGGTLLNSAAEFPRITAGLAERGFGEESLAGILGGNHLRLLEAVIG